MRKHTVRQFGIIFLAYMYRYAIIVVELILWVTIRTSLVYLVLGLVNIVFALYGLIGYLLRWKHIYCSYQNAYHKKMTPDKICWSDIKKSDAYGIPIIFCILGIALIICYLFDF